MCIEINISQMNESALFNAFKSAAYALQVSASDLISVFGNQKIASDILSGKKHLNHTDQEWQTVTDFIHFCVSLVSLVGGNETVAQQWMHTKNRSFDNKYPINILRTKGLQPLITHLDQVLIANGASDLSLTHWMICLVEGETVFVGRRTDRVTVRITSSIQYFDPVTQSGVTRSGRIYSLIGPPGLEQADIDEFNGLCEREGIHQWQDITDSFISPQQVH